MTDVVTDKLEASFEALEQGHLEADALREEVARLQARLSASERREVQGLANLRGWSWWR